MPSEESTSTNEKPPAWLDAVRREVERVRFGCVTVTVHDGKVTQIESTKKTRVSDARD